VTVYFGQFYEDMYRGHIFGLLFAKANALTLTKNALGKILGDSVSHRLIWGRCYDHSLLRFSTFFGEQIGVFLKIQCFYQFLSETSNSLSKKTRQFVCQIVRRKYFENHNIGPWQDDQMRLCKKRLSCSPTRFFVKFIT
jgi:hypothetical protein